MAALSESEVREKLQALAGWQLKEGAIVREHVFPSFPDAIAFVNQVAILAEKAGHHPEMTVSYKTVTLRLWTWSEGGITERDLRLARRIEGLTE